MARTGYKYLLAPSGSAGWHVGGLHHLYSTSVDAISHGKSFRWGLLFTDKGTHSLPQVWEGQLPSASFYKGLPVTVHFSLKSVACGYKDMCNHPALPLQVMSPHWQPMTTIPALSMGYMPPKASWVSF